MCFAYSTEYPYDIYKYTDYKYHFYATIKPKRREETAPAITEINLFK